MASSIFRGRGGALAFAAFTAGSLARAAPESATLEEIVVTADRAGSFSADLVQAGSFRGARQLDTPLTVNVIPAALIESQQAVSLLDAMRNTAGVSPAQVTTTVYSSIAIRGLNVENRSNYRLNGILPIVNLVDLPLEDKQRVEVLKGASALYYGFTTPAGIVNLTMKRPTADPYVAATLFGNQFGAAAGHVDVGDTWGPLGARVNAVYGSVDSGIDDTRGHRKLLAGAFDFKALDNFNITLDTEYIEKEVAEPGIFHYVRVPPPTPSNLYPTLELPPLLDPKTNFGPDWALSRAEEHNVLGGLSWKISPSWSLAASYGTSRIVRDRHSNSIDLDGYGPGSDGDGNLTISLQPGARFRNTNYRLELSGAVKIGFTTHQLLLGASRNIRNSFTSVGVSVTCPGGSAAAPRVPCRQNIFDPTDMPETPFSAPRGPRTRIDDIGYYLFDRIEMAEWLQILAGVRKADYTESNRDSGATTFEDGPTAVSAGAILKPRPWLSLYTSYIEGLETTSATPIAAANFGESLPATQSIQGEAGVKIEVKPGLLLQAAYFNIERDSAYVNTSNVYVLDGRARYRGVEFSATGEVTPDWSVYLTGQFLSARQISGADTTIVTNPMTGAVTVIPTVVDRKIENAPERTFSLATEYRFTRARGLSVNGAAYYLSERAVNEYNQAFIPGFTVFDLGAAWTGRFAGSDITVRVTGQNVANRRYFAATGNSNIAQAPPRTWKFSLTTRF